MRIVMGGRTPGVHTIVVNCMLYDVYCVSIELDMTVSAAVILTHRIDPVHCSPYQYHHLSDENCYYGRWSGRKWRNYSMEDQQSMSNFPLSASYYR